MSDEVPPLFLWVAIGGRSSIPDRLEVRLCPRCAALVAVGDWLTHVSWHRPTQPDLS